MVFINCSHVGSFDCILYCTQIDAKLLDFKHRLTKQAPWIDSWRDPPWVKSKVIAVARGKEEGSVGHFLIGGAGLGSRLYCPLKFIRKFFHGLHVITKRDNCRTTQQSFWQIIAEFEAYRTFKSFQIVYPILTKDLWMNQVVQQ